MVGLKHIRQAMVIMACLGVGGGAAHGASPIGNVGSSTVNKGELEVDWRMGYTLDDEGGSGDKRFQMRQHIDYSLTDWYALRLIVAQDRRDGDNLEHRSVTFENRFEVIELRDYGWSGGIRLLYGQSDGDKTPHELDVRWMAKVPFGADDAWEWRHNTIVEHDIGENSRDGIMLELRNQITKAIAKPSYMKKLRVGAEIFNDFGRLRDTDGFNSQDHQFGPVVKGYFNNGLYFQAGYRAGVSDDAVDHLFKLFVGRKF